ncbi:MAG: methionyl-tRNA formyltransferase [Elusimicrobiota bacterium]
MRLLFFGSPGLAVPFLQECVRASGHELVGVVTQPDRPAGRGLALTPPPVKAAVSGLRIPVLQPLKASAIVDEVKAFGADMAVVVAYGQLLKSDLLAATRLGFLNVHFSLLPKYRGAAPVQWSLVRGERRSGVTLFWIDQGLDTGPIQRQASLDIGPAEDAVGLFRRMVDLGVRELREGLREIGSGDVRRQPQQGEPSLAPKIPASLAVLDFALSASEFHDRVRGLAAGPRAHLFLSLPGARRPLRVLILKASVDPESGGSSGTPGSIVRVEGPRGVLVQCASGRLWVQEVQPEGKRPISATDFINGARLKTGGLLETVHERTC